MRAFPASCPCRLPPVCFLPSLFSPKISAVRRERVDRLLVERGLAPSRTRAQALVMAGLVLVGEQRVGKPSETYPPDAPLRVRGSGDPAARHRGRGGLKLEKAPARVRA